MKVVARRIKSNDQVENASVTKQGWKKLRFYKEKKF